MMEAIGLYCIMRYSDLYASHDKSHSHDPLSQAQGPSALEQDATVE